LLWLVGWLLFFDDAFLYFVDDVWLVGFVVLGWVLFGFWGIDWGVVLWDIVWNGGGNFMD
jgi:hypothetical protein